MVSEDWGPLLAGNPRVLWSLVADVVKAAKAAEGERKTGRRPAVSVSSLDELYDILFPAAYVEEPFHLALAHAMTKRGFSQVSLAAATGFSQAKVSRMVSGRVEPTCELMEGLAVHLQLRPTYFSEYRAQKLGQLVTQQLLADPVGSSEAIRRLLLGAPA